MDLRFFRLRAIGPPLAVAAISVAALVWFDRIWIPTQQQYLNERNLRALRTISAQIKAKVDNFDQAIDHAIDSVSDRERQRRAAAEVRQAVLARAGDRDVRTRRIRRGRRSRRGSAERQDSERRGAQLSLSRLPARDRSTERAARPIYADRTRRHRSGHRTAPHANRFRRAAAAGRSRRDDRAAVLVRSRADERRQASRSRAKRRGRPARRLRSHARDDEPGGRHDRRGRLHAVRAAGPAVAGPRRQGRGAGARRVDALRTGPPGSIPRRELDDPDDVLALLRRRARVASASPFRC